MAAEARSHAMPATGESTARCRCGAAEAACRTSAGDLSRRGGSCLERESGRAPIGLAAAVHADALVTELVKKRSGGVRVAAGLARAVHDHGDAHVGCQPGCLRACELVVELERT